MIAVLNTLIFQVSCIVLFSCLYWIYIDDFVPANTNNKNKKQRGEFIDCVYTSITIQAGVGYNGLDPISDTAKMLLMAQQFVMICANVIIFYLVSSHLLNLYRRKK